MSEPLRVILCWHMHQPEYRDLHTGEHRFPWTWLHAIKDYVDMAAHLEAWPRARAVVNFAPVLLEQIEAYSVQIRAFLAEGSALHDPLLAALGQAQLSATAAARYALVAQCLRANERRVIARFPAYARLTRMARWYLDEPETLAYASDQFLADLVVWYHLGWIAETVRRTDARVQALQDKGIGYTSQDRRLLLGILLELLDSLFPRYRALAAQGRVELAMSPCTHPILPLLIDTQVAAESLPDAPLPAERYPGGLERARWHLQHGREVYRRHLGVAPRGCWPSEGALSNATLALLAEEGFEWTASGEAVLHNSLAAAGEPAGTAQTCRHRAYRIGGAGIDCYFRDDGLSDLIGFRYADWHAEDAVANFVHHLEAIAAECGDHANCAVTIILDGENAWEYYPENAYYFLDALYRELSQHPRLLLSTFSDFRDQSRPEAVPLPALVAGSWVYGTLSTWIGSADKNRGWELLIEAKKTCDRVLAAGTLSLADTQAALAHLAACEGSDWFWWFGDYNPAQSVSDFEQLFRLHLTNLYRALGVEPPAALASAFTHGSGTPELGGVMRRADPA